MRTPSSRREIRLFLIAGSVLAWIATALVALEVVARFQDWHTSRNNSHLTAERQRTAQIREAFDESLWEREWYSYRPGAGITADTDGGRFQIAINSRGFRSPEVPIPRPPDRFRIVCIGGSTTVEGMTDELTYPALLQDDLRQRLGNDQVEVVNCGVSGLAAWAERERLPDYLALEPNLILEYNLINDLREIFYRQSSRRSTLDGFLSRSVFFETRVRSIWIDPDRYVRPVERFVLGSHRRLADRIASTDAEIAFASFCRPDIAVLTSDERAYFEYDLHQAWGAPSLSLEDYVWIVDQYNARLREFCAKNSILYLPLAEQLHGGTDLFSDLCHMTQDGIARKARILGELLEEPVRIRVGAPSKASPSE